ncbi:MAG: hypothetical protein RIB60_07785 [Phycisphaerales bacterium]
MGSDKQRPVVARAGSSVGHAVFIALAVSGLWYTFDDRLAVVLDHDGLGLLGFSFVFPIVLAVSLLVSVAGMHWEGG